MIANYWLDDTRQEMDVAREKREGKRWFAWSCPFHTEKTKPFFDEQGRAIELLEAVRFNDIHGPLADQSLFLMGGVKLFNEDYREADYYYTDIVQNYPNSEKAGSAVASPTAVPCSRDAVPSFPSMKAICSPFIRPLSRSS